MDYKTFFLPLFILKNTRIALASKSTKNFLDQWVFSDSSGDGARIFMLCLTIRLYPLLC